MTSLDTAVKYESIFDWSIDDIVVGLHMELCMLLVDSGVETMSCWQMSLFEIVDAQDAF